MTQIMPTATTARPPIPRVLVVDDETNLIELVDDVLVRNVDCQIATAANVADGRRILQTQHVDLMVIDLHLPDGSGADLLTALRKHHPFASAIVMTGSPSVDGAVTAMRHGAVDFLAKPFTSDDFLKRVRSALLHHAAVMKNENRIDRLREAVRRLNEARRVVTKKVDLLCNDLVSAYGDLSRQLDTVRTTESFRGAIHSANDLEQMLCHAMDWMLRQIGYANVAVWLAAEPGFQLGAYMKYTIPGEPDLVDAMRMGLLPLVTRNGIVHLTAEEAREKLTAPELKFLKGQTILAAHCTYLGESLAQIILFRDEATPFTDDDLSTLKAIGPIFAVTLATMVRDETDDEDDQSPFSEGGPISGDQDSYPEDDEDAGKKSRRKRKDDADWWKRGEQPPF
ncbi:MAG: response regulator [Planctomycetota bacterium]|nr:response regulator [Planctomycetota bacterium]